MQRYQRQIILPDFGVEAQRKLTLSKVLVVGAGGLGCPVLLYLCAAGVGNLGIVDADTVDLSNLQRQVLYEENDIGFLKAEVACEKLKKLNTEIQCKSFSKAIDKNNVFEIVESYDIVVDCTDNFASRYLLNDVCALLIKPLVYASIFQYEAQLSVFHYGEHPFNLRDLFPEIPASDSVPDCSEAGVLGVLTGIAGNFQANEAIKIITGIGNVNSGKLLIYNSLNNEIYQLGLTSKTDVFFPKNKEEILLKEYNFVCGNINFIDTLEQLNMILHKGNTCIIDVRNTDELPKISSFKILEIPLQNLDKRQSDYENFEYIVFLCQSGIRSKRAIELLQSKFPHKHFYNIKKGIALFE